MSYQSKVFKYNRNNGTNSYIRGTETMDSNYLEVFEPENNRQFSNEQEPDISYRTKVHMLHVSSAARDVDAYPKHYDYTLKLDENIYKNVTKVEILAPVLPNTTGIQLEPFLIIDIKELNCVEFINGGYTGYGIIPLKGATGANDGTFVYPELGCINRISYEPDPVLAKLTRLTIKIRDSDGALFTFGNDSGSTDKALQHSFTLKIHVSDADRNKSIRRKNVY